MKKALVLSVLAVSLSNTVQASDCDPGVFAFKRQQYTSARFILEPLAKKGDACAQYYMGLLYISGHGVKEDKAKGLELIMKADEAGYPETKQFFKVYQ